MVMQAVPKTQEGKFHDQSPRNIDITEPRNMSVKYDNIDIIVVCDL